MNRVLQQFLEDPDPPIESITRPFQRFMAEEASGGLVLLGCTVASLIWINSVIGHSYETVWDSHLLIGFSEFMLDEPIHFWINDALMALFFFAVGLEIKRAVLVGELATLKSASLPLIAAIGGMVVPAVVYLVFNAGGEGSRGWGVPMATDIAFSLGVLALLGSRVPLSLKVFLAAFAIVDDIGAVAVIAAFYTESISFVHLAVGGGLMLVLFAANVLGVRHPIIYALIGAVIWVAFLKSGIHATVAGVVVAATIPLRVKIDTDEFLAASRRILDDFESQGEPIKRGPIVMHNIGQRAALAALEETSKDAESPLQRLEHSLHPWVAFAIMPLFALSNAGVEFGNSLVDDLTSPISLGIILGLFVGKPVGIVGASWLAVRTGIADMPSRANWRQMLGVAWLGGIGFTMSIFIGNLAFVNADNVSESKIGILVASIISGVVGYLILRNSASEGQYAEGQGALH